jgi:hypothetical protein
VQPTPGADLSFASTYLADPDRFPPDGERRWGRSELVADIVGGPYRLLGLSAEQRTTLRQELPPVDGSSPQPPAVTITVHRASHGTFRQRQRGDPDPGLAIEYVGDRVHIAGWGTAATMHRAATPDVTLWTCYERGPSFAGAVANALRVTTAYRLLSMGGVVLHSAGIVSNQRAHLFVGHSGAGKTTLSSQSLEAGRTVLSDDLNAVLTETGRVVVRQLPFAGDLGRGRVVPGAHELHGLYRLEQGPVDRLRPLSRGAALATLASCCPGVNADPQVADRLVGNLDRVLDRLSMQVLTFRLDGNPWQVIEPCP